MHYMQQKSNKNKCLTFNILSLCSMLCIHKESNVPTFLINRTKQQENISQNFREAISYGLYITEKKISKVLLLSGFLKTKNSFTRSSTKSTSVKMTLTSHARQFTEFKPDKRLPS